MKFRYFSVIFLIIVIFTGCSANDSGNEKNSLVLKESVNLLYAQQFSIDRYENGCSLIKTADNTSYLIVPEGQDIPSDIDSDMKIIRQPADNIYLAATSAMGLFDALGEGSAVKFSGTKAENWYIDYARKAMENGDMLYAGKYREPDYELLVSENCVLSVQSTMINHNPDVKDKLEELGITVFTDLSSYETHPLGRSEWIKVYGEMTGKQQLADELFNEQVSQLNSGKAFDDTGKTAVYFYITDSGQIVTRKSGDYITRMIELAGGKNVFENLGNDNASSAVTVEPEIFYETAKDADYIIYNSTISGEINSVDEIISKYELLAGFKAVENGNVWCTKNNLFQETMKLGTVIRDFNAIFTDTADENPPEFLYKPEEN